MAQGIQPEGEGLRRAVRWISERRKDEPQAKLVKLIDEAAQRFDLSPLEADYLLRALRSPQGQP